MSHSFLILGCGNMASALVKGLYRSDESIDFYTYTPSKTRASKLAADISGSVIDNLDSLPKVDYIMLACKPQQFGELAKQIVGKVSDETTVISILAGTRVKRIQEELKIQEVVRVMPNTPALIGAGVNAFYFDESIVNKSKDYLLSCFNNFSEVFDFESVQMIDTITPFSGSGPAYFFELNRILIDYLIQKGISVGDASAMMKATALGAAKLMSQSSDSVRELRNKVTSKGGVTFEALQVFKDQGLERMTIDAIDAALKRNEELSQE